MRKPTFGRALAGILAGLAVLLAAAGCSRSKDAPEPRAVAETRPHAWTQDPNSENPDRDSWVDLAKAEFDPRLVGGRFVQVRDTLAPSLNAVLEGSADVAKMHKFLLGAPLLMETPDKGPGGFDLIPFGAASLPEESPDHLVQTWTLRGDLTWEDGKPVTAHDYAFTFGLVRNKDVDAAAAAALKDVAAVEEIDARRFRVRWSKPSYRAAATIGLDFPLVPAHAVPADAASFNKTTTHLACGPYRVASFEPAKIELVLRDEYRAKRFPLRPSYVERFVWESGGDPTAAFTRLLNGEAHLVILNPAKYASDATTPAFAKAAWRTHYFMPSFSYIAWNLVDPADPSRPHPILGDVRVRRALSQLIPLDRIAATAFHGLARPVSAPFDFRDSGCDPAIAPFAFDPAAAAGALREACWTPGVDGVLAKEGRPLRIKLARPGAMFAAMAQIIQEEARKAGVEIVLEDRGRALFTDMPKHQFDAGMVFWQLDTIEPDVSAQWHSGPGGPASFNYSAFADAESDRLLDAHAASFDRAERAALHRRLHARLHDELPATFLLANASTVAISRRFANVKVHDLGVRFHDFVLRELWEKYRPK